MCQKTKFNGYFPLSKPITASYIRLRGSTKISVPNFFVTREKMIAGIGFSRMCA